MINKIDKNSTPKSKSNKELNKNTQIKYKIEDITSLEIILKIPEIIINKLNIQKYNDI